MKNLTLCLVALLLSKSAVAVPESWVQLPEDSGPIQTLQPLVTEDNGSTQETLRPFDTILNAQLAALNPSQPNPRKTPWRMVAMISDIAFSAKGLIGVLTGQGRPGLSVYWQKQEQEPRSATSTLPDQNPKGLIAAEIKADSSNARLDSQVSALKTAITARQKIDDESLLEAELKRSIRQFRDVALSLDSTSSPSSWELARYRLDLGVQASGRIAVGLTAGAALRIRLDWIKARRTRTIESTSPSAPSRLIADRRSFESQKLKTFIESLAQDLEVLADAPSTPNHFEATSFFVGLGISLRGDIGIAKTEARAMGYLYFNRSRRPTGLLPQLPESSQSGRSLLIIENDPPASHLQYARLQGIDSLNENDEAVYQVDRKEIRKGLLRALAISQSFAERASHPKSSDWKIRMIKTSFELSLSGSVALATLSGSVATSITLNNTQF